MLWLHCLFSLIKHHVNHLKKLTKSVLIPVNQYELSSITTATAAILKLVTEVVVYVGRYLGDEVLLIFVRL
jgi:hypothetical protein